MDKCNMRNNTKSKLVTAFYLVIKNKSILHTNVKEICEAAGIARSTFYVHYDSLEAFFREIAVDLLQDIENYLLYPKLKIDDLQTNEEKPYYYYEMNNFLVFLSQNRNRILPFIYPQEDAFFVNRFKSLISQAIRYTFEEANSSLARDEHAIFAQNLQVTGTMFHWLIHEKMTKEEVLDLSVKFRELLKKKNQ